MDGLKTKETTKPLIIKDIVKNESSLKPLIKTKSKKPYNHYKENVKEENTSIVLKNFIENYEELIIDLENNLPKIKKHSQINVTHIKENPKNSSESLNKFEKFQNQLGI